MFMLQISYVMLSVVSCTEFCSEFWADNNYGEWKK